MKNFFAISLLSLICASGCSRSAFMPAMTTHQAGEGGDPNAIKVQKQATIPEGRKEIGNATVLARSKKKREKLLRKVAAKNGGTNVVDVREELRVPMAIIPIGPYPIVIYGTLETATVVK